MEAEAEGGYGDYLRTEDLYKNWIPNNMGGTVIPAGSDQMLGSTFAIWNDNIDTALHREFRKLITLSVLKMRFRFLQAKAGVKAKILSLPQ